MSEPRTAPPPAPPPAYPAFCSACGGQLPGPVLRCPRCGAVIGAQGGRGGSSAITIVAVVVAVLFGGTCLVGILAAIAIPNFIRYQLRSKEAGVAAEVMGLVKSEQAALERTGRYVALDPLPAAAPGTQKRALSPAEQQAAAELDWMIEPATYGRFRVAVGDAEEGGQQAAAICAESDLDGDGVPAARVAFLLGPDADPEELPPAPCTEPVPYEPRFGVGQVTKVSGDNVF